MRTAPKVEMRPVAPADSERLLTWRNLPDVARWMYTDHEISRAEHERWFAAAMGNPRRRYWIIEVDGAPTGLANLVDIDEVNGKAAWAYYLADPATRGKGIGAYVEYWVIEQVFGPLGLKKLWCEVLVENEAVWKLHESFGFQREALFRSHVRKRGEARDVVGLGLLAEDWVEARPRAAQRLARIGFPVEA